MNNILQLKSNQNLVDSYDIKGSTYKRYTDKKSIRQGNPKKDLNILEDKLKIPISDERYKALLCQIDLDA